VTEDAREEDEDIKRGLKGGRKHKPGRGHARKSQPVKKKRIGKRLKKRHAERREQARKAWEDYDKLPPEAKKLVGEPKLPRPRDEP
jgi:hypothetical protein